MHDLIAITRALADESRLRILAALDGRELCVCQVVALLGRAPATVSKHLAILHQAGLISARKAGRWVHYRRAGPRAPAAVRAALRFLRATLTREPRAHEDARRLTSILNTAPEVLCCLQRRARARRMSSRSVTRSARATPRSRGPAARRA